ncbi:MAG: N-6 DNA methylase [Anaerolineales bacterium]
MAEYDPVKLESFVRQRAPKIAQDIRAAAEKAHNEADLVAETEKVLDKFAKNFDIQLHLERERTLINGRADAVYNRFVIEYEPPHSLQKSNTHHNNKHAIEQVQQYMGGLERLDRQRKERLAGAVLDGGFFIFVRFRDDHWHIDDPLPVDAHSTEIFLRYLLALSTELALTPENLVRDFGENSNTARRVVPALYTAISTTKNKKAGVLFQQWQRQFREVSGYDPESGQLDAVAVGRLYAVKAKSLDLEKLFFAIHTYYAAFIKMLALQVAYYYLMPKMGSGLAAAASYPGDKLCKYLQEMERGGLFHQLGICNFLEGDFFGWYLDIWDEALDAALRRLINDLANYSLVTLDVDPEETRDLLKQLYQNLMPRELRHALGEYYTPDWLADRLLNQLGYDGNPCIRLLDPACGSGTFLVLAIKRVRTYAEDKMLQPAQVLEQVLDNIVGFDLNPLAVISARTNYLLALGDLLAQRKGEISIPIYLADSILTPTQGADLFSQHAFSFNTAVGRFSIPRSLVHAHYIDKLADLLEECVHMGLTTEQFLARLLDAFPFDPQQDASEVNVSVVLFEQLLKMEQQGINGIWARIIKNAFAPLFQGRFDCVAGNPPWINWESLPEDYRRESIPLWHYHGMVPPGGLKSIMGHSKMDISELMTYVASDDYLKDEGKLGFVITQSVLKTSGAGQTFRRFTLGSGTPIAILSVDDLVEIQPFEGANNRTAVIILKRNHKTKYPVSYNLWRKAVKGIRISEKFSLNEALSMCEVKQFVAQPVDEDDLTSSWITGKRLGLKALNKVLGKSDYAAHAGAYSGGANGVYWLELIAERPDGLIVVNNVTEGIKREVDNVQTAIEPDCVFPLLKSRNVRRWAASPEGWMLIPRRQLFNEKAIPEKEMIRLFPKTYNYLMHFKDVLALRKDAVLMRSAGSIPFYSIGAVSDYTFAPYKVVWPNMGSNLTAAVITNLKGKVIIPQHILTLVATDNANEAHYICAVVNSSPFNFAVQSYSQKGGKSFGTPSILENVRVPRFDPNNKVHQKLASLSQQAHAAASTDKADAVKEIEAKIDEVASQVWGLTKEELVEIQESLEELQ